MFTPNQLILGKYRIERELGRGAFGVVYLARHKDLETLVAIKTLHKDAPNVGSTEYGNYRARFLQEAKLSAKVKHPNVLRVLDFAEQDGGLISVMDYAAGGSLAELLQQTGPLPIAQVCQILREAAAGLNALHEADAVHRDVKPSNMLLDGNGRVLIADMGLAQVGGGGNTSRDSRKGSLASPHPGTPNYMSPEHSNGNEPLSPSADVYSLGCVAFEMLTGKLWKSERRRVREVRDLRPDTPDWLNSLVTRMLKQAPAIEYDDANDLNKRYIDCQAMLMVMDETDRVAQAQAAQAERIRKEQEAAEAKRKAEAKQAERIRKEQEAVEAKRKAEVEQAERIRKEREATEAKRKAEAEQAERIRKEREAAEAKRKAEAEQAERIRKEREAAEAKLKADRKAETEQAERIIADARYKAENIIAEAKRKAEAEQVEHIRREQETVEARRKAEAEQAEHTRSVKPYSRVRQAIGITAIGIGSIWGISRFIPPPFPSPSPTPSPTLRITIVPANTRVLATPTAVPATFTPVPSATITPIATQGVLACSENAGKAVTVKFVNLLTIPVNLYWVDPQCKEILYTTLSSNQDFNQPTYANHIWRVRNLTNTAILFEAKVIESSFAFVVTDPTAKPTLTPSTNSAEDEFQRGFNAYLKMNYVDAINLFNNAITKDPKERVYYWRGKSHIYEKNYDLAILDFAKAIELNPNNPDYWQNRGVSYWWKKDYDRAIADESKAIELNPNNPDYWWERGTSYWWKNDYDRAIADYNKAIELNPNNPSYWRNRGVSYHEKKDYDRAITDYSKAIELNPNNPSYWRERGGSYHQKKDYERAIADISKAIELNPNNADYWWNRGKSYGWKNDYDRAIADESKAIELNPNNPVFWRERGVNYHNKKDYDRAIADYNKAIELNPNDSDYWYLRNLSYRAKGDTARADADLAKAKELGWK